MGSHELVCQRAFSWSFSASPSPKEALSEIWPMDYHGSTNGTGLTSTSTSFITYAIQCGSGYKLTNRSYSNVCSRPPSFPFPPRCVGKVFPTLLLSELLVFSR